MISIAGSEPIAKDAPNEFWWRSRVCLTGLVEIFDIARSGFTVDETEWIAGVKDQLTNLAGLGRFIAGESVTHLNSLKEAADTWERRAKERGWKAAELAPAEPAELAPDDYARYWTEATRCLTGVSMNVALVYLTLSKNEAAVVFNERDACATLAACIEEQAREGIYYLDGLLDAAELWKSRAIEAGWVEGPGASVLSYSCAKE